MFMEKLLIRLKPNFTSGVFEEVQLCFAKFASRQGVCGERLFIIRTERISVSIAAKCSYYVFCKFLSFTYRFAPKLTETIW